MQVHAGLRLTPEKSTEINILMEKIKSGQEFSSLIGTLRGYERSIEEIKAKSLETVTLTSAAAGAFSSTSSANVSSEGYEGQKDFSGNYISKHWSVSEWDCFKRNENKYAYTDSSGKLATSNENTANLFRLLDTLRAKNSSWIVNNTSAGYKSGYRDSVVNAEVGGVSDSNHTAGCAADIHDPSRGSATGEELAKDIEAAAAANGLTNKIELGKYKDWCHIAVPGYRSIYTQE